MHEITWHQAAALRLRRQHLDTPASREAMLDVVCDLVAVQAQVMSSAELAICSRVAGIGRDDVARALWLDRTLIKTWAMRGTLHLVAARVDAHEGRARHGGGGGHGDRRVPRPGDPGATARGGPRLSGKGSADGTAYRPRKGLVPGLPTSGSGQHRD